MRQQLVPPQLLPASTHFSCRSGASFCRAVSGSVETRVYCVVIVAMTARGRPRVILAYDLPLRRAIGWQDVGRPGTRRCEGAQTRDCRSLPIGIAYKSMAINRALRTVERRTQDIG